MQATTTRPKITATTDGEGVVSHAAARLLADVADAAGVPAAVSEALAGCGCAVRVSTRDGCSPIWRRCSPTAAKRSVTWRVLRDQPTVSGPVASTATTWRMLDAVDDAALARVRDARAQARERAWLLRADAGRDLPARTAGGRDWPGLVLDVDATVGECHSDKKSAAPPQPGGSLSSW